MWCTDTQTDIRTFRLSYTKISKTTKARQTYQNTILKQMAKKSLILAHNFRQIRAILLLSIECFENNPLFSCLSAGLLFSLYALILILGFCTCLFNHKGGRGLYHSNKRLVGENILTNSKFFGGIVKKLGLQSLCFRITWIILWGKR